MDAARDVQARYLYSQHSRSIDHGSWSVVSDIRWGDIDTARAQSQPGLLMQLRAALLELSARGATTARLLPFAAEDPNAAATFTLELWDTLKHLHVVRTYLDVTDAQPVSDEELRSVRRAAEDTCTTLADAALRLILAQHTSILRWRRLAAAAEEPVLVEILAHLAADEVRRAQITGDLLALRMAAEPETVAAVKDGLVRMRQSHERLAHGDDVTIQSFVQRVEKLCAQFQSSSSPFSRT